MIEIIKNVNTNSGYIPMFARNEMVFKSKNPKATRASIISGKNSIDIYPDPKGIYRFDLGIFAANLSTKIKDDYSYEEDATQAAEKLVLRLPVSIQLMGRKMQVLFTKNLGEYSFLRATDAAITNSGNMFLNPQQNLTVYKGYPFDYTELEGNKISRKAILLNKEDLLYSTQNIKGAGQNKRSLMFFNWKTPQPIAGFRIGDFEFIAKIKQYGQNFPFSVADTISMDSSAHDFYKVKGLPSGHIMALMPLLPPVMHLDLYISKVSVTFSATKRGVKCPVSVALFDAGVTVVNSPYTNVKKFYVETDGSPFKVLETFTGEVSNGIAGCGTKRLSFKNTSRYEYDGLRNGSGILVTQSEDSLTIDVETKDLMDAAKERPLIAFAILLPGNDIFLPPNFSIKDKCGIYLKWLNPQGAYSYHLFEKYSAKELLVQSKGTIQDNETDDVLEIGKVGSRKQNIHTQLQVSDSALLESLMLSPEVYIYTGKRFSGANSWERIRIINPSLKYADKKNNKVSFTAECELKKPLTQHI